jgi:hypothetical protein
MTGHGLTAERLRELLHYDKATGIFTWVSARRGTHAGSVAGCINNNGYWLITVDGVKYRAHRLAWLWVKGKWPPSEVDHRNTKRSDNRWRNLRLATFEHNQQNRRRAMVTNKVGLLGVRESGVRFSAGIFHSGKDWHLGTFDTPEEAHAAYVAAKRKHHPGCTL